MRDDSKPCPGGGGKPGTAASWLRDDNDRALDSKPAGDEIALRPASTMPNKRTYGRRSAQSCIPSTQSIGGGGPWGSLTNFQAKSDDGMRSVGRSALSPEPSGRQHARSSSDSPVQCREGNGCEGDLGEMENSTISLHTEQSLIYNGKRTRCQGLRSGACETPLEGTRAKSRTRLASPSSEAASLSPTSPSLNTSLNTSSFLDDTPPKSKESPSTLSPGGPLGSLSPVPSVSPQPSPRKHLATKERRRLRASQSVDSIGLKSATLILHTQLGPHDLRRLLLALKGAKLLHDAKHLHDSLVVAADDDEEEQEGEECGKAADSEGAGHNLGNARGERICLRDMLLELGFRPHPSGGLAMKRMDALMIKRDVERDLEIFNSDAPALEHGHSVHEPSRSPLQSTCSEGFFSALEESTEMLEQPSARKDGGSEEESRREDARWPLRHRRSGHSRSSSSGSSGSARSGSLGSVGTHGRSSLGSEIGGLMSVSKQMDQLEIRSPFIQAALAADKENGVEENSGGGIVFCIEDDILANCVSKGADAGEPPEQDTFMAGQVARGAGPHLFRPPPVDTKAPRGSTDFLHPKPATTRGRIQEKFKTNGLQSDSTSNAGTDPCDFFLSRKRHSVDDSMFGLRRAQPCVSEHYPTPHAIRTRALSCEDEEHSVSSIYTDEIQSSPAAYCEVSSVVLSANSPAPVRILEAAISGEPALEETKVAGEEQAGQHLFPARLPLRSSWDHRKSSCEPTTAAFILSAMCESPVPRGYTGTRFHQPQTQNAGPNAGANMSAMCESPAPSRYAGYRQRSGAGVPVFPRRGSTNGMAPVVFETPQQVQRGWGSHPELGDWGTSECARESDLAHFIQRLCTPEGRAAAEQAKNESGVASALVLIFSGKGNNLLRLPSFGYSSTEDLPLHNRAHNAGSDVALKVGRLLGQRKSSLLAGGPHSSSKASGLGSATASRNTSHSSSFAVDSNKEEAINALLEEYDEGEGPAPQEEQEKESSADGKVAAEEGESNTDSKVASEEGEEDSIGRNMEFSIVCVEEESDGDHDDGRDSDAYTRREQRRRSQSIAKLRRLSVGKSKRQSLGLVSRMGQLGLSDRRMSVGPIMPPSPTGRQSLKSPQSGRRSSTGEELPLSAANFLVTVVGGRYLKHFEGGRPSIVPSAGTDRHVSSVSVLMGPQGGLHLVIMAAAQGPALSTRSAKEKPRASTQENFRQGSAHAFPAHPSGLLLSKRPLTAGAHVVAYYLTEEQAATPGLMARVKLHKPQAAFSIQEEEEEEEGSEPGNESDSSKEKERQQGQAPSPEGDSDMNVSLTPLRPSLGMEARKLSVEPIDWGEIALHHPASPVQSRPALLSKILAYLPAPQILEVGAVSREWATASAFAEAQLASALGSAQISLWPSTLTRKVFPWGRFLAEGAYKQVFRVWNAVVKREEALSIMDTETITASGNEAVVVQELRVSMLVSSLIRRKICPNFVETFGVFRCCDGASEDIWGSVDNYSPQGAEPSLEVKSAGQTAMPDEIKALAKSAGETACTGRFQYIGMELCAEGDLEELLRRAPGGVLPPMDTVCLLFQALFALFAGRQEYSMRHYDVKLLNFLACLVTPSVPRGSSSSEPGYDTVVVQYGLMDRIYRLELPAASALRVKLADFGTADVNSATLGEPIGLDHFTTLENTPPELLICGTNAAQDFAKDTFSMALAMLHLYTGEAPYEELMEAVVCPDDFREALANAWGQHDEYNVIVDVVDSCSNDEEDEVDSTLFDTLYRYLVLFGIPSVEECIAGFGLDNPVCTAIHSVFLPAGKRRQTRAIKTFAADYKKWSIEFGTVLAMARARGRMAATPGAMDLLLSMAAWDPAKRPSMCQAMQSELFDALVFDNGEDAGENCESFMAFYGSLSLDQSLK